MNIIKKGPISLLPHLAADHLDKILGDTGNNLKTIAASGGHAEFLQHPSSLLGQDCLNEQNVEKLTSVGLATKNGVVRWIVSETEAFAELSCLRIFQALFIMQVARARKRFSCGVFIHVRTRHLTG